MGEVILLKRSAVPSKVPSTGDLNLGEMAINTYDGDLFIKKDNGTATIIKFVSYQYVSIDSTFADNSDTLIPSQSAVKTAIDGKQDLLVSGTNIKTLNGNSILGSGDIPLPYIPQKSGTILAAAFTGNPKKATVTFTTAFVDANYSVSIIGANARSWSIESITASGFVINANANAALTGNVYWVAKKHVTDQAGVVSSGSFSGNPKKATVTFNTPLDNSNYSVTVIGTNSRTWTVESITQNGFTINSSANAALTGNVYWTISKHGEFS